MSLAIHRLLHEIETLKHQFGSCESQKIEATLRRLSRHKFSDAESLIHFHETLLFLRAYPQSPSIVRATPF